MAITLQQASFIFGCLVSFSAHQVVIGEVSNGMLVTQVATALTIMSVYSWFRSTYLSLPMPRLALLLSALIPFANLFGLRHFVQDLQYNGHSLSPEVLGLIGIADAVLMTLASAQLQLDHLSCSLDHQWQILFSHKDSGHIRRIQDGLNCCGFKTTHDRAWPFPDNQTATACERTLHRRSSCLPGWKREEKTVLAFMIAIGGLSLLSKACEANFGSSCRQCWQVTDSIRSSSLHYGEANPGSDGSHLRPQRIVG